MKERNHHLLEQSSQLLPLHQLADIPRSGTAKNTPMSIQRSNPSPESPDMHCPGDRDDNDSPEESFGSEEDPYLDFTDKKERQ